MKIIDTLDTCYEFITETVTTELPKWPSTTRSLAAAVDKQTSIHGPLSQVRVASNTTPPMHPADTDIGQTQRESAERDVLQKVEAIEIDENYELDKIDSRYGSFSSDINVDHKSQEFFFKIGSNQNVEHNLPTVEEGIETSESKN